MNDYAPKNRSFFWAATLNCKRRLEDFGQKMRQMEEQKPKRLQLSGQDASAVLGARKEHKRKTPRTSLPNRV